MKHRISAGAIVIHEQKILLVNHKKDGHYDFWVAPGGGVKGTETTEQTAIREVKEETGLDISVLKLAYIVRGRGLMFAIDICDENTGNSLFDKLIDKGYIVCNRKALFRIDPPLIINEDEFYSFIREFKNILELKRNNT